MRPTTAHPFKKGGGKGVLTIVALSLVMLVFTMVRAQKHRPLIEMEAAIADSVGEAMFAGLGTSPGAVPAGFGEKQMLAKSEGAPTRRIVWRREYEVPGAFDQAHRWYHERVLADGWKASTRDTPSELVRRYQKGKWLLTISRFTEYNDPPRSRIELQLEWYYWRR